MVGHLTDSQVPEFDFNFATVYLLEERDDGATAVRMAAGAATAAAIESGSSAHPGKKVPRWAMDENRVLAEEDVLVYVARSWQPVIVGPMPWNAIRRQCFDLDNGRVSTIRTMSPTFAVFCSSCAWNLTLRRTTFL